MIITKGDKRVFSFGTDMEQTLISVIIPIYNVEKYLEKCIESVIAQTYKNIEIILVDDGSPDGCGLICDEFAQKDSRIKVIHKENGGLSDARNAGLDITSGEYVMFVDSDDYISCQMCSKLYRALTENDADLSACNFLCVDEDGREIAEMNKEMSITDEVLSGREILENRLMRHDGWYWVISWNKLYKKTLFDKARFKAGKQHEDEFIAHEILSQCERASGVSDAMYYYVQRGDSIMGKGFTVKNLDAVEALFNRADMFIRLGFGADATYRVISFAVVDKMYVSFKYLDYRKAENRDCYKRCCERYGKVKREFIGTGIPLRYKIALTAHSVIMRCALGIAAAVPVYKILQKIL